MEFGIVEEAHDRPEKKLEDETPLAERIAQDGQLGSRESEKFNIFCKRFFEIRENFDNVPSRPTGMEGFSP